jgi:XTP/dITP diphosphohydrolase
MGKLIVATKNKGKISEIKQVLVGLPLEVISMGEAGIDIDIVEDGATFEENSLKKAQEICKASGSIVMADDSGLEVDYLDGAPGIYSARFAGTDASDTDRNNKLLALLKDVPFEKRTARFVCAIACAFPNGEIITRRGVIEGYISKEICGFNGFGYDPIFYVPEFKCTTAEMSAEQKNEISHRGKALRAMKEVILNYIET